MASATTAQEAAVRLPENAPGSYEPPDTIVIETSGVAVLNKVDLVDILQANQFTGSIMKRIAYALLLLACTCPPSHAQEYPIGTPASADSNVTLTRLQWLVGNWADDADDGRVEFQFELVGDGGFLKNAFSSSDQDGNVVLSGVQVIGKDPETQSLRSWTFDSQGGRGEAEWTYVDGRWLSRSSFTLVDGSTASAINVYTKIDEDSFEWKSVSREVNGELQPALPPSIVRRVIDSPESVEDGTSEIPVESSETESPEADKACAD